MKVPPTPATPSEAKLQRQILDWITVVSPKRGDILVIRVPVAQFIHPGTPEEDVTDEQRMTMEACHKLMGVLVDGVRNMGIPISGAAILSDEMKLEDLPPPWAKPEEASIPVARAGILLPPGTKL